MLGTNYQRRGKVFDSSDEKKTMTEYAKRMTQGKQDSLINFNAKLIKVLQ